MSETVNKAEVCVSLETRGASGGSKTVKWQVGNCKSILPVLNDFFMLLFDYFIHILSHNGILVLS